MTIVKLSTADMINRHTVLEYLDRYPNHSTWQMRLHFLQEASRQLDRQSTVSISSIANQLNYILRDLESIGKIPQSSDSPALQDSYHSDYRTPVLVLGERAK